MGFCIYCNQNVYSNSTCPKCFKTISTSSSTTTSTTKSNTKADGTASSRISTMFGEQKKLNQTIDKWQDTYGKKAIFNNGGGLASAAPISRPRTRMMPQFNASTSTSMTQPAPESSSVSTPLLSSLATSRSTLTSSSTTSSQIAANKSNAYFQYQRSRRSSMFNRTNLPTEEESATMDPAPTKTASASAIVTSPTSSPITSTRPPLLNKISEEKNDFSSYRRGAKSSSVQDQQTAVTPTASVSTTAAPAASIPKHNTEISSSSPPTTAPKATDVSAAIEPKPRKRRVVKKPCKECGQHVCKKDYRGLKIHTGEVFCFHSYCLFCAKCHQNFNGLEFCTDGKNFYHTECPDSTTILNEMAAAANNSREGSPLSEEEEAYPQTPPPNSHDAHFDIVDSSEDTTSLPFAGNTDLPKKRNVIDPDSTATITTVMCDTCALPVNDSTCLELANQFYHKECLLCAGCNKTVPTDRKLSKFGDKLYCDHCSPASAVSTSRSLLFSRNPTSSTSTPLGGSNGLRINADASLPKRAPTITTPSDIFKSRKKVLPRLGGVRTCARCNLSMPFSDTQPGPHASRWHKKCLRCAGCNKQMDSDAHMTVNEETGLCLVHCRACLDETPKPRFVR